MGWGMKIYGLKNCDTCRKALKALPSAELQDIRATPLDQRDIDRFFSAFGDALVNRKSTTWRGMDDDERARPAADLLAEYPALMKRPVIEHDGELYLGWGEETQKALL